MCHLVELFLLAILLQQTETRSVSGVMLGILHEIEFLYVWMETLKLAIDNFFLWTYHSKVNTDTHFHCAIHFCSGRLTVAMLWT